MVVQGVNAGMMSEKYTTLGVYSGTQTISGVGMMEFLTGEGNLNVPDDDQEVFRPVDEWHEDIGTVIFFKLHAGEPPCITDPLSSDWVDGYFTHWIPLPKCFSTYDNYIAACERSGIEVESI